MIKNFPKEEFFSFLKIFIFCFAVVFLVINLGTIKRMYNYKLVYGEKEIVQTQDVTPVQEEIIAIDKPDSIEIPKIQITAPLVFIEGASQDVFKGALDRGVVYYPESVLPGEPGQTIFLGHSAPPGWPKIKHDWVFSELNDLIYGDQIFIYFNNKKYTYTVEEKLFLDKGEELPENSLADTKNVLVLLSCWPPGADNRRIAVIASP